MDYGRHFPSIMHDAVVAVATTKERSAASSSSIEDMSIGRDAVGAAALVACAFSLVFVLLAFPTPAHSLSLEARVTLIEATMFTKADAAEMRKEMKADELSWDMKADEMRKEMKSDMAAMNTENRVFSICNLVVSSSIPAATFYRAIKKEEIEKAQKLIDEEKEKAQKIIDIEEKKAQQIADELSKKRSVAKDFQNVLSYFR